MSFGPPPSRYTASTLEADRRVRRRRLTLLTAVAAVLAVLGAGLWAFSHGDDEAAPNRRATARQAPDDIRETVETPPRSVEAKSAAYYTETLRTVGENVQAMGTWVTDGGIAKGFGNSVLGIRFGVFGKDGRSTRAWRLAFPGPLCAVTPHVSVDGRTAVVYSGRKGGPGADLTTPCDRLAVFDVDTGKKTWDTVLPGEGSGTTVNVTMTDGTVVAAWGQGSAAYDMTSGERLWADLTPSDCEDVGFAGGRGLLALVSCGDSASPTFKVERVAARTGKAQWTYQVAPGIQGVHLVSASPAVIGVAAGDLSVTDLISLGEEGRARATIRLDPDHQDYVCDQPFSAAVEGCDGVVVGGGRLYIRTVDDVVAHDLATGRTTVKFDSPEGRETVPLRMSGGKVIAYRRSSWPGADAIVSLDPTTGTQRNLLLFSPSAEDLPDTLGKDDLLYEHGRAVFAPRRVYGPTDKGEVGQWSTVAVGVESVA
ncbi:PQQ-binding-like beta-propeller repeat protein [Streptomyces sp. bgisy154]|uniref:outer membrane protein assembly factor BamB family protein n=1 Tax=Streptomyces sp. bgisy154 TaxID=3413794 RepID=UPI003D728FE0